MSGKHKEPKEFSGDAAQFAQFIKTAKEAGCGGTEAEFDNALGKLSPTTHRPKPRPKG
jgi:hypothetical protein